MKRKSLGVYVVILVVFGLAGLLRFSDDIPAVKVLGLFGSGMTAGAALAGIISVLRNKQHPTNQ